MQLEVLYLDTFKKASKHFKLMGNKILVERIELGEVKTAGGLYIGEVSNARSDFKLQKPHVAVVLAVGDGYFDAEENKLVPLDVKVGNVVILNSLGVQYYSLLPGVTSYSANKVGLSTEGDIQIMFDSVEQFKEYAEAMNEAKP